MNMYRNTPKMLAQKPPRRIDTGSQAVLSGSLFVITTFFFFLKNTDLSSFLLLENVYDHGRINKSRFLNSPKLVRQQEYQIMLLVL